MRTLIMLLAVLCVLPLKAADNLVLVTIDGLRWQEVFYGADQQMLKDKTLVKHPDLMAPRFGAEDHTIARSVLMHFMWQTIAREGALMGNRDKGPGMSVANPWFFSYPGYSEILTGIVDESIDSNAPVPNANVTFLEWLSARPEYGKKLALFGSWDVFPAIVNHERSGLHVNAGFMPASGYPLGDDIALLNQLQKEIPSPWHNVRLDAFTHRYALDYLKQVKPRVMVIAYGETDDFAHDGQYDQYLMAARRTDNFIADLWHTLQSMPEYRNNTNLIITTDHGRGSSKADWQHHSSRRALSGYMSSLQQFPEGIVGSDKVWLAAMGPDIKPVGVWRPKTEIYSTQIVPTILTLLGESAEAFNPEGAAVISEVIKP
ncbi:alkaline phosphatase family protein [Shewanella corallii]|uniref:Alkaline phosphatase family protein n=1 Tax=Shewanella corallii TaxID=560080 RepID=A0ABT0N545_9GAMM|nr:alkaline phosphatase family protein [Shewanella corallii]MCL2913534.1 alkaline phosphatase family protein [Shewanella corallii]